MEMKYTFVDYYKYRFLLKLENGRFIENPDQDSGEIYRLGIEPEGVAKQDGDDFLVDGVRFTLLPLR